MIECIKFKSFSKGDLQGFADFYIPKWGVELCGCALFKKGGKRWIRLPSQEYQNNQGEKKYAPIVKFKEKSHEEQFLKQAKAAIDGWCREGENEKNS